MTTSDAINLARLLDLHLARSIARHGKPGMNKLSELAAAVAKRKREWDARADAMLGALPGMDSRADAAFQKHEKALADAEAGFRDLEKSLHDLEGSNNPPGGEGSDDSSKTFSAGGA